MADDAATGAEELDELAGASLDRYLEADDLADLDRARRLYATALSDAPDDPYLLNNCLRVCHDAYGAIHASGWR